MVNFVDKKGDKIIPDEIDPLINSSIQAGLSGDWETAEVQVGTALNKIIDIPLLGEDTEQSLIVNALKVIVDLIRVWITNSKK